MTNDRMDFADFVERMKGKDLDEILWQADREATEAQRVALKQRRDDDERSTAARSYANRLVRMIDCLRFEVRPTGVHSLVLKGCLSLKHPGEEPAGWEGAP